jgi:hypothetical protein
LPTREPWFLPQPGSAKKAVITTNAMTIRKGTPSR